MRVYRLDPNEIAIVVTRDEAQTILDKEPRELLEHLFSCIHAALTDTSK